MHQVAGGSGTRTEPEIDAALVSPAAASARLPRGPLRPERLVSVRQRNDRRLAAHRFRALDTLLLLAIAVIGLERIQDAPLLHTALADAIPVAAGTATLWWLVRSLHLYRFGQHELFAGHLAQIALATGIAIGATVIVGWITPDNVTTINAAAAVVASGGVALVGAHVVWFGFVARWRARGLLTPNVAIVGATEHAEELVAEALERRSVNIIGIFDDRAERSPQSIRGVPVLSTTDGLLNHRVLPFIDLILIAIDPAAAPARVRELMDRLSVLPNEVVVLVDDDAGGGRRTAAIDQFTEVALAPLHPPAHPSRRAWFKRVQDLAIGVPLLVMTSPILAALALAVRLDSPGPVFFKQRRHGFNNEEIVVWKFRTMRHEAADATASRQVTAGDDRITRVGRILRKTGLDELPQLFNVVAGEMSLVGPRPHAIGMRTGDTEAAQLVADYAHRHRIKPGMTGWAAINGSRGPVNTAEDVAERVAYDIAYIERQSFWLDLKIMLKTVPTMLGDRRAVR